MVERVREYTCNCTRIQIIVVIVFYFVVVVRFLQAPFLAFYVLLSQAMVARVPTQPVVLVRLREKIFMPDVWRSTRPWRHCRQKCHA